MQVHREAHGMVAEKIIQVEPEVADLFLGGSEVNAEGAALLPGGAADVRDPGIRTVLFTESSTRPHSRRNWVTRWRWNFCVFTTASYETPCWWRRAVKLSILAMASWPLLSAAAAVRCAMQIQRELARRERENTIITSKLALAAQLGNRSNKKQRYFWNDCAIGGAALFPRRTRPNPGIDRGSGTMYREGLIIASFGRSRAQRF